MKSLITAILVTAALLGCNGDVSESRNHKLPLSPPLTIPSPAQSLQPPTFENPIKDYTVGLVPPPVDNQLTKTLFKSVQQPHHHHHHQLLQAPALQSTPRFIAPKVELQQRLAAPRAHVHQPHPQHTHHASSPVQPQVYQPKTAVHQQYQQPSAHRHNHHHHQPPQLQPNSYSYTAAQQQPHSHHISVSTPLDYYTPITHPAAVHQHPGSVYYPYAPVHRVRTVAKQHIHPSPHQSTVVPPSGVRIIQTYPSVSYAAALPQHGSTLSLGGGQLEPDLVYVISEVLHRYHPV